MRKLVDAVETEVKAGAQLEDLVVLVHSFNQQIAQEVSNTGLRIHVSPFVPIEDAYLLNTKRCTKALAWSLGFKLSKEDTDEKVANRNSVLSHVHFGMGSG